MTETIVARKQTCGGPLIYALFAYRHASDIIFVKKCTYSPTLPGR